MSEIVASGVIEKRRLVAFLETFASKPVGMKKPVVQEAKIHFDDDGMTARAVDASNVLMVGPANLAPRGFEAFEAQGSVTIGVSLTRLIDRLDPAGKDDLISFEVDMETRHLRLQYGSAELSIALIDPESVRQEPDVPDHELPNTVVISGDRLDHALSVTEMVSDHVHLEGRPDDREVVFRTQGDVDDATVSYGDDETLDGTKVSEGVLSIFSLDYLKAVSKPIPGNSEVELQFGDEFPMYVNWSAFDGDYTVQTMVAPRIQSD